MFAQVLEIVLVALFLLATVYGAARARATDLKVAALRTDVRAVLGSLGYTHGSLEVISAQLRRRVREELPDLERVEWTPAPGTEVLVHRRPAPRNDVES